MERYTGIGSVRVGVLEAGSGVAVPELYPTMRLRRAWLGFEIVDWIGEAVRE